jgi:MFS transporter, FHS family, L-fucose permease
MNVNKSARLITPGYTLTFILVTMLFYFWALPNNMNDILIPQFMKSFELNRLKAGLVQSAFYLGYFLLAIPAALVMDRYGYKRGLLVGLLLFASGCFLFWPAASAGKYLFFLGALFVIASGLAFLETGSNSFISILGDPDRSEQRLNLSQSFNPLGSMTGVLIGTIFIFSGKELSASDIEVMKSAGTYRQFLHDEIIRVGPPYLFIGAVILIMAFLIWRAKFPENDRKKEGASRDTGKFSELIKYPHYLKGVLAEFFYVGAQVGTWSFLIQYLKDNIHKTEKEAGVYLTISLLAFAVGRFVSTALMKRFEPKKLMGIYGSANVILVLLAVTLPGFIGSWALILSSFFMSLMFPTIFALGVKGLGPNTKLGGSGIIMGIIGGAAWTPLMGFIADRSHSMALAMIVPMISYVYVTYYAFIGSKPRGPLYNNPGEKIIVSH